MNYRSVVIFGKAKEVTESDEKMKAMRAFTEHIVEGRWDDARIPNEKELNVTTVLRLAIDESSAKIRTGGPVDDAKDYELDFWAGVVPLGLEAGNPIDDEKLAEGIDVPEYLSRQKRFAK